MSMSFPYKKLFIATAIVALVVAVYLVYALAGLNSRPVVFADPPEFVEQYAVEIDR